MAKKSFSNFAYGLFRAALYASLKAEPTYRVPAGFGLPEKQVEDVLFPEESAQVQRFRDASATAHTKKEARPKIKIPKALREQARADYEAARGTTHRRLLVDAEPRLQREARAAQKRVEALLKERAALEVARDAELERALIEPIVEAELPGLPGIGPRLAGAILAKSFTGRLSDLRQAASRVDGIGPQKQATIDAWVDQQQDRLSLLLNQPFPGKSEIEAHYQPRLNDLSRTLTQAQEAAQNRVAVLQRVYQALAWLIPVGLTDFEWVMAGDGKRQPQVTRFLLGIFPPCEPPPDWFVAALEPAQPPAR